MTSHTRVSLSILFLSVSLFYKTTSAEAPDVPLAEQPIQEIIVHFANEYNQDPQLLLRVAFCESGYNPQAWNKNDPYGGAKGIFQYLEPTFYSYSQELGIENPDIWDSVQQAELTAYLFSKGKQNLWTCSRKV